MRCKLLGDSHPLVARSLNNLAAMLENRGDYEASERLFREALAIWRQQFGDQHPDVALAMWNLAFVMMAKGDYAAAEPLLLKSYTILKTTNGDQDKRTQRALKRIIDLYNVWNKPEQAAHYQGTEDQ